MNIQDTLLKTTFIPVKKSIDFAIKLDYKDYKFLHWNLVTLQQTVTLENGSELMGAIDKNSMTRLSELKDLLQFDEINEMSFVRYPQTLKITGTSNNETKYFEI